MASDTDSSDDEYRVDLGRILAGFQASASKARKSTESAKAAREEKEHQFDHKRKRDKAELQNTLNLIKLRLWYGRSIPLIVGAWLVFVGAVVLAVGCKHDGFELSDTVMVTLLTTTTVEVIGLTVIVTRSLFPAVKEDKPKK